MKKVLLTVLAGALAGLPFVPARAEDEAEKRFDFNGEARIRYEKHNNYTDVKDTATQGHANDDGSAVSPYRAVVGVTGHFAKDVNAHVDLQYSGYLGDQGNPTVTYGNGNNVRSGLILYQGWLEAAKIAGSDFGIRLGRQEHTYGTELFLGDNDYYNGQTLDGLRGMWQQGGSDLNLFYYKINERNDPNVSNSSDNGAVDHSTFGATYDYNFKSWGALGGYWIVDQEMNSNNLTGTAHSGNYKFNVYGIRWNRPMMDGDTLHMFDWNIEYADERGSADKWSGSPSLMPPMKDVRAWIGEGWFAFNFHAGQSTHGRVHVGALITSGDHNQWTGMNTPDVDEDFRPLFGDFHANNRFGDMDWIDGASTPSLGGPHGITDYNVGYEHWFDGGHYIMFAYHGFQATEPIVVPPLSAGNRNGRRYSKIGYEFDLKYTYQYSKNLSFEAFLGQASPNHEFFVYNNNPFAGPVTASTRPDLVKRAALQARVTW